MGRALQVGGKYGPLAALQDLTGLSAITMRVAAYSAIKNRNQMAVLLGALADLEALYAMSEIAAVHPRFLVPVTILDRGAGYIDVQEAHHFYLAIGQKEVTSIGNPFSLSMMARPMDSDSFTKSVVFTGPNTGGKTTYLRTAAIVQIIAQTGGFVPVARATLVPCFVRTHLHVSDSTQRGASTFFSDSQRIAQLLDFEADAYPLLIFADEVGSGTDFAQQQAVGLTVFKDLYKKPNTMMVYATHDRALSMFQATLPGVGNLHVSDLGHLVLPGPATTFNAADVMAEAGVPKATVDRVREEFERIQREGISTQIYDPKTCKGALTSRKSGDPDRT
ncbi:MAG: hypothetical protein AB7G93_22900 [Bdellovibrionales bacterium]